MRYLNREMPVRHVLLLSCLLSACGGDISLTDPNVPGGVAQELHPEFNGATLVVHSPAPAEIMYIEDGQHFTGEVLSADGEVMDFEDIVWTSSIVEETVFTGKDGDVDLDAGVHVVTATAELPNGDRLQYVVGGVRVQGRHTGVYAGSMNLTLSGDYQGTPISAACVGALDFIIDMQGEALDGQGGCTLAIPILGTIDVVYEVTGDVDDPNVSGNIALDLGFFDLPLAWDGGFEGDDVMAASYEGSMNLFVTEVAMDGQLEGHRVTQYLD